MKISGSCCLRREISVLAAAFSCAALCAGRADVLRTATDEYKGEFRRFEKDHFVFATEKGDELRLPRSSVRCVLMQPPREVEIARSGGKTTEQETLAGYDKMKFCLIEGGRTNMVLATAISGIRVPQPELQAGVERASDDAPRAPRTFDVSALETLPDLTPDRKAVIDKYKEARGRFDAFVKESAALVARMDRATGPDREKLLDALRSRKNEEQPLKRALERATADLLAAFPDIGKGSASSGKTAAPQQEASNRTPLMILDVSGLASDRQLTEEQTAAVKRYQQLAGEYKAALNGTAKKTGEEFDRLVEDVKRAEADLLKAFPDVQVVEKP